jgi:hypothetical protein
VVDWQTWHSRYDDPASSLAHRLIVVRHRIRETLLMSVGETPLRILSLCAGDGRDLLPELATLDGSANTAVLIENNATLATRAAETADSLGLPGVTVIVGDAGASSTFTDHVPVDLLLLCGIFGNISEDDIRATVAATPTMLRPGGTVIWTRGATQPDVRLRVRAWFEDAGLDEISFDAEPGGFGVGVHRADRHGTPISAIPLRLFTFSARRSGSFRSAISDR